ncbi:MAG: hypothetical protein IPK52_13795 [Chloroflexi bacterium]|nr:hypothetical protein [Chloroflexota bacterium]
MLEYIKSIDWASYRLPGTESPDILLLMEGLLSDDFDVADLSAVNLSAELDEALITSVNDLPFVVVPILIKALNSGATRHKSILIGILTELTNHTDNKHGFRPKEKYARLRIEICKGSEIYRSILSETTNVFLTHNLTYILDVCAKK